VLLTEQVSQTSRNFSTSSDACVKCAFVIPLSFAAWGCSFCNQLYFMLWWKVTISWDQWLLHLCVFLSDYH